MLLDPAASHEDVNMTQDFSQTWFSNTGKSPDTKSSNVLMNVIERNIWTIRAESVSAYQLYYKH